MRSLGGGSPCLLDQFIRLSPLNSLRAFECAARHLSFTKAAEELHATPGEISQQIRVLEEFFDTRLFKRRNRLIVLTDEGQGIGLVGEVLAANDIAEGRLIQPFETRLPVRLCYHLVTSRKKARSAKVIAFREWILAESSYLREPLQR